MLFVFISILKSVCFVRFFLSNGIDKCTQTRTRFKNKHIPHTVTSNEYALSLSCQPLKIVFIRMISCFEQFHKETHLFLFFDLSFVICCMFHRCHHSYNSHTNLVAVLKFDDRFFNGVVDVVFDYL